ncbi:MAG: hypothetical protein DI616_01470 [Paracoccus denitrificans]|uniref:Lipoprotein n=1 Tax=Paracoccus denitrificans TaxID=266 RepID=A0A533ID46_PARDE|nr:MAG: hypothetical protein DI616_01470 [Paracoccus denitrificans]
MKRFMILGAASAITALTAACMPTTEEPISRAEADMRIEETTAPAAPVEASGAVEPANTLNGSYNLRSTECGVAASEGALTIQGSRFQFYESQCTAVRSTSQADAAEVQLSCDGEGQAFERLVKLRLSPGVLQMEENAVGLRYYRCPAAS